MGKESRFRNKGNAKSFSSGGGFEGSPREVSCGFGAAAKPPALLPEFSPSLVAFQPSAGFTVHPLR